MNQYPVTDYKHTIESFYNEIYGIGRMSLELFKRRIEEVSEKVGKPSTTPAIETVRECLERTKKLNSPEYAYDYDENFNLTVKALAALAKVEEELNAVKRRQEYTNSFSARQTDILRKVFIERDELLKDKARIIQFMSALRWSINNLHDSPLSFYDGVKRGVELFDAAITATATKEETK